MPLGPSNHSPSAQASSGAVLAFEVDRADETRGGARFKRVHARVDDPPDDGFLRRDTCTAIEEVLVVSCSGSDGQKRAPRRISGAEEVLPGAPARCPKHNAADKRRSNSAAVT